MDYFEYESDIYEETASIASVGKAALSNAEYSTMKKQIKKCIKSGDYAGAKRETAKLRKNLKDMYDEVSQMELDGVADWFMDRMLHLIPRVTKILQISMLSLIAFPVGMVVHAAEFIRIVKAWWSDIEQTTNNKVLQATIQGSSTKHSAMVQINRLIKKVDKLDDLIDKRERIMKDHSKNTVKESVEDPKLTSRELAIESVAEKTDIPATIINYLTMEFAEYSDEVAYEMAILGNVEGSIKYNFYTEDSELKSLVEEQAAVEAKLIANKKYGYFEEDVLSLTRDRYQLERSIRNFVKGDTFTLEAARDYKRSLIKSLNYVYREYSDELFYSQDDMVEESAAIAIANGVYALCRAVLLGACAYSAGKYVKGKLDISKIRKKLPELYPDFVPLDKMERKVFTASKVMGEMKERKEMKGKLAQWAAQLGSNIVVYTYNGKPVFGYVMEVKTTAGTVFTTSGDIGTTVLKDYKLDFALKDPKFKKYEMCYFAEICSKTGIHNEYAFDWADKVNKLITAISDEATLKKELAKHLRK